MTAPEVIDFSAMLMAGIDGVVNGIEPPDPVDQAIYSMSAADLAMIRQVPGSLDQAMAALERDNELLMRGGVFTDGLIEKWLEMKQDDVDALRLRPRPIEFFRSFDAYLSMLQFPQTTVVEPA